MADFELVMPKMGESITEATILKWMKKVGDHVEEDETILEIATDKVDSEIPSPIKGVIRQLLFQEDDVVAVGETIAYITTDVDVNISLQNGNSNGNLETPTPVPSEDEAAFKVEKTLSATVSNMATLPPSDEGRFYSPLVRNIAKEEGLNIEDLRSIEGSGLGGRITKKDVLSFINSSSPVQNKEETTRVAAVELKEEPDVVVQSAPLEVKKSSTGDNEIVQMDRMRKLIATHMVHSKQTSPHVTSFVEADVTNLVKWREGEKEQFLRTHGTKITFTPIFIQAVARAISDFPMINVSVEEDRIIVKKDINIGMATALPTGNLIVPVVKNADNYNLVGLAKIVNDLAERSRSGRLKPEEVQEGTFTFTNVGTFGNVMGTPIINQPQVAILAVGAIRKKPAVVETPYGDLIAIRHMMFLSLSYDHRVVDGMLGGSFLRCVADYLEQFNGAENS